mgnify:CR=1 FL=1
MTDTPAVHPTDPFDPAALNAAEGLDPQAAQELERLRRQRPLSGRRHDSPQDDRDDRGAFPQRQAKQMRSDDQHQHHQQAHQRAMGQVINHGSDRTAPAS